MDWFRFQVSAELHAWNKWSRSIGLQCESKFFYPLGFSKKKFPKRLRIFNINFTRLLFVYNNVKLQNFIQLSPTMTKLCRIKRDHPVIFFSFHQNFNFLIYSPVLSTWLPCVGCNASDISQTSPKAKDHSRAKKCTTADLGWLAADND